MPTTAPTTEHTPNTRTILHIDGDAFFVAVEIAKNPTLRGKAVVTGEERGIVSALSYEAKALGIKRGMPIFQLKKEFPQVIILPGDYRSYVEYSRKMFDIVRRYIDDVEEYSIDECFGDLTGLDRPLKMSYRQIAERIKHEIITELDLSVSIGIAPTKVLAKVASKWVKPNGLTVLPLTYEERIPYLKQVAVENIWGIGRRTAEVLKKKGIYTAHNFAEQSFAWIEAHFALPYQTLWQELHGQYCHRIDPAPKRTYASIQRTRSFHPATNDATFLFSQLSKHIEDACSKARHFGLAARKVSIFIKTKDFRYVTGTIELTSPTHAPEMIIGKAREVLEGLLCAEKSKRRNTLYRTTGVTLHDLVPDTLVQNDLFGATTSIDKLHAVHRQIDMLEEKYGKRTVYLASTHHALQQKVKGTDADEVERNLLFL